MNARAATLAVPGAGSWGTALAIQLVRNGSAVSLLWGHDPVEIEVLLRDRENRHYLPGVALPEGLTLTGDLAACLRAADEVLWWFPAMPLARFADALSRYARSSNPEPRRTRVSTVIHELPFSTVAAQHLAHCDMAVVRGRRLPGSGGGLRPPRSPWHRTTWMHADRVAGLPARRELRAYTSDDLIGVQVGAPAKERDGDRRRHLRMVWVLAPTRAPH